MNPSAKSIINRILVGGTLLSLGSIAGLWWAMKRDPVWAPLFNGEDLSGWTVQCLDKDRGKNYWSVKNGAIVCDSVGDRDHGSIWLQQLHEFDDFELKLKFKAFGDSPGNSGVQVRSRWEVSEGDPGGGRMHGPQVDIHPPLPWRTGLIYDETSEVQRWINPSLPDWNIQLSNGPKKWLFYYANDPNPWNEMIIRCQGSQITTTVNRMVISDFDGEGILNDSNHKKHNVGVSGFIALQLHGRHELKIHFKDIFIRKL